MAIEPEKTFFDYAAVWSPIILSIGSLVVSWFAFKKAGQSSKEIFINSLRDKVKNTKHTILGLINRSYSQDDKMVIVETIQDLLLYQGYIDEKNNHLTPYLRSELSILQEEIEDIVGAILIQDNIDSNKTIAKSKLNAFLKQL